ncbi:putative N-formylglutamate amidohydrolase [Sulfitobacter noctilucicola]|uniref:Putative N-formylglutamate amidohydrolase n=1 Tax=Sulfitobacter noctilucicola TaxID=1342301 RepID=A0A7W6MAD3_9RHOB|nr:N-formylglutamate amidohydrolase [Sulfitobacter noctilucicola]KIN63375.1 putative N-formylglutamate amidohydrolase [Sulfitobacter noctilucicola]MBB4175107.1 putative N-formylglutamate amidohydrolase [Sulfitobacter noctilucicola]
MNQLNQQTSDEVVEVINPGGAGSVVLVCEHASPFIPPEFNNLGLDADALNSHAAWDPGALAVARIMATELDAVLVASRVSRLVYDCNRPPEAAGAMPAQSEIFAIPGNADVSLAERTDRTASYYKPFRAAVAKAISARPDGTLVTIHSFTPVYHGKRRDVEIGILHDSDTRLADAMLESAAEHSVHNVQRNAPYGPEDGVTHTLKEHGLRNMRPNVMIEVRNDLLLDQQSQQQIALELSGWVAAAVAQLEKATSCSD